MGELVRGDVERKGKTNGWENIQDTSSRENLYKATKL